MITDIYSDTVCPSCQSTGRESFERLEVYQDERGRTKWVVRCVQCRSIMTIKVSKEG